MAEPLLQIKNLSKHFGAVKANDNICLDALLFIKAPRDQRWWRHVGGWLLRLHSCVACQ